MNKDGWRMLCLLCLTTIFIFVVIAMPPDLFSISINLIFHVNPPLTKHHHNGRCDLSKGGWVRDWRGQRYTNQSCKLLHQSFDCEEHGKDMDFTNWRWKPDGCELPRFDAERFLRIVRGKRMAFIGDSIGRNHYNSLLCLLSQVAPLVDMMEYQVDDMWEAFHFPSHNFTLSHIFSHFLVEAGSDLDIISEDGYILAVDMAEGIWTMKLRDLHYVVLSCGQWFIKKNYLLDKDNSFIGCTFCKGTSKKPNVTSVSLSFAVQRALTTALQYIRDCEECEENGLLTIVRLASPSHFESGKWNEGGSCNRSLPFKERDLSGFLHSHGKWVSFRESLEVRRGQKKVLRRLARSMGSGSGRKRMKFVDMDVTRAMLMRPDAHPGLLNNHDCLHWCLPGPIDFWNDVLLHILGSQQ